MAINDGGPAFPQTPWRNSDGILQWPNDGWGMGGMSRRDYFSAKFAAAWVIALSTRHQDAGWTDAAAAIEANRLGLEQADMMLVQLAKEAR